MRFEKAFYLAANRALDLTIENVLGRDAFDRELQEFRNLHTTAVRECEDTAVFPCAADGRKTGEEERDCFWGDAGCGATCLDEVAARELSSPPLSI